MDNIQSGTVVKLKSGGPRMTVKYYTTSETWLCTWFNSNGELKESDFTGDQLEVIED